MNIADVYDWFARESMNAGKQANKWKQRETFFRLVLLWATAAQQCRKEASTRRRGRGLPQHRVDRSQERLT
jgi:hypothetical protein